MQWFGFNHADTQQLFIGLINASSPREIQGPEKDNNSSWEFLTVGKVSLVDTCKTLVEQ